MKRLLPIIFFLTLISTHTHAQRKQNITIQGLGSTPLIGLQYDTRFIKQKRNGWGASFGIGSLNILDKNMREKVSLSIGPNYLIGQGNHQLILGGNGVLILFKEKTMESTTKYTNRLMFIPDIGYRLSPKNHGFTAQLTWNPLRSNLDRVAAFQYLGLALGYAW